MSDGGDIVVVSVIMGVSAIGACLACAVLIWILYARQKAQKKPNKKKKTRPKSKTTPRPVFDGPLVESITVAPTPAAPPPAYTPPKPMGVLACSQYAGTEACAYNSSPFTFSF